MFKTLFGPKKPEKRSCAGCKKCRELYKFVQIGIPAEFRKVLDIVRANMSDKIIRESDYWPEYLLENDCETPFNKVTGRGKPLEPVYTYYFECTRCGQIYHLFCSTVTGCKGKWRPLKEEDFK